MKECFGLYLILTDPISGYGACARAAVDCGVKYLQLRMKKDSPEVILRTAQTLLHITKGTDTKLIINDSLEIAMRSDADGVHLGQNDMNPIEARKLWNRSDKLIGLSTHSDQQARDAGHAAADYIGIGPVFSTATKADTAPALGTSVAGEIAQNTSLPSVAIGGINTQNLASVLEAGFQNYCVVSAVNSSPQPVDAIQALQKIWKNHSF